MKKNLALSPKKKVIIQDWIKFRPYNAPGKYDMYYLKVANQVRDILADNQEMPILEEIDEEDITLLACIITSYFEDFTNEIGMWQAFINTNQKTIGKFLPFYDLSDYETDYLNRQDIEYLIWHYVSRIFDEDIFAPDALSACADDILAVLEDNLDDAPVNAFYDNYLQLGSKSSFIDFKDKLLWVALKSYMLGVDLAPEFDEALNEMMEEMADNDSKLFNISQYTYLITEDFLYTNRTGFNTLNAPEVLAMIMRVDDKKREEIRCLQYRHTGNFVLEKVDNL
jgi:hypothetical protein